MVEIKLYDIGDGIVEGDVLTYFVNVGDKVSVDQPLVEIQTDKMVAELPSPVAGTVKEILIETGTTITVGTTVMLIEAEGEIPVHLQQQQTKQEEAQTAEPKQIEQRQPSQRRVLAAPYTRKIARDHNVDISLVEGTGPAGRVTEEDIYRYLEQQQKQAQPIEEAVSAVEAAAPPAAATPPVAPDIIPFKGRRKQIAKKMVQSVLTIPHVQHFEEVDMTELLAYRNELKELNVNISVAAFFIKALGVALKEYPIFNAKLDEEKEEIRLEKEIHMGLATDTKEGLIVPVLRNVEKKSLTQIHDEMKELTKKAQENKLTVKDITGSTFTISNVGPMGSIGATPIINYPEVALMAFHKTKKMPVVNEKDEIVIRSMMNVTMTFDHRVADGGAAVAFTNRMKELLENPKLLTLALI